MDGFVHCSICLVDMQHCRGTADRERDERELSGAKFEYQFPCKTTGHRAAYGGGYQSQMSITLARSMRLSADTQRGAVGDRFNERSPVNAARNRCSSGSRNSMPVLDSHSLASGLSSSYLVFHALDGTQGHPVVSLTTTWFDMGGGEGTSWSGCGAGALRPQPP
jgi:hypothetical protein